MSITSRTSDFVLFERIRILATKSQFVTDARSGFQYRPSLQILLVLCSMPLALASV
ncbi:MAG: hypothetical protein RMK94_12385 [Armatimonadota bacterium]|nr:hypothetical protein [Armatimonadota bacterium]